MFNMHVLESIAAVLVIWIAVVLAARWIVIPLLCRGPGGDAVHTLMWLGARLYCRLFHRVRWLGWDEIRRRIDPGGLIVVSNHTSSVDPALIQTGCWFHIRWLMASEMMTPNLDWVWNAQQVIPISRDGGDTQPVRDAIRHVRNGGVIGIFPEGRIVQPRGEIRPFHNGVGAIAVRTGAPVLLVWVSGTPDTETMAAAFATPSRSRVRFVDLMRFTSDSPEGHDAAAITQTIRKRLSEASRWPLNDERMPNGNGASATIPA